MMKSDTLGAATRTIDAVHQYCKDITRVNGVTLLGLVADTPHGAEKHIMLSPYVVHTSKLVVKVTAGQS